MTAHDSDSPLLATTMPQVQERCQQPSYTSYKITKGAAVCRQLTRRLKKNQCPPIRCLNDLNCLNYVNALRL